MGKKFTKLWLLTKTDGADYEEFDSCVVAADTEEEARLIKPENYGWCVPELVGVEYIGKTDRVFDDPVICSSFNAG